MENIPELNDSDLMKKVEIAAERTMANEIDILQNGKVERSFTSHFAHQVEMIISIDGIRADPFCNKHLGAAKYLDGKLIELDIAVHKRHVDERNLIAIELETNNYPKRDDLWKVEKLTEKLYGYGYQLGLYIVFGIGQKAGTLISTEWFKRR